VLRARALERLASRLGRGRGRRVRLRSLRGISLRGVRARSLRGLLLRHLQQLRLKLREPACAVRRRRLGGAPFLSRALERLA
jgi:hypothetical protein